MTITVTKTISIGKKSTTTTASAEIAHYLDPAQFADNSGDEMQRAEIIRVTAALLRGMEAPQFVTDKTGAVVAEVHP